MDKTQLYQHLQSRSSFLQNHQAIQWRCIGESYIRYIPFNPADTCILPRVEKAKVTPCDDAQISPFIKEVRGNRFETLFVVTLFTGVREGEILGLTWDCVDFDNGVLTINKQMQLHQDKDMKAYQLVSTKNSKARTIITAAPFVMERLKHRKVEQTKERLLTAH